MGVFLLCMLCIPMFCQETQHFYEEKDPTHRLNFYSDGIFKEFYGCWAQEDWLIPCNAQCQNISIGTYVKRHGNYILTSYESIPCVTDTIQYFLSSPVPNEDSTVFIFNSPYEELFKAQDRWTICTTPHERVYLYHYSIICNDDSLSKEFEHEINNTQEPSVSSVFSIKIPDDVKIKALHLKITWKNTLRLWQDPSLSCETTIVLPEIPTSPSLYTITLPQFNIFYLAEKKYIKKSTRSYGKNRFIINGTVYKKLID